ncbi:C4-dicarboxylate ABC transporter [Vineibacter terrae]|uniref:C4-dicarboxylate ABC transporter n=1 Tax=Vineibacter terrae TaxID=2586908 RepID=A0A5C8PTL5_9HYPH|nr:TRAP transporter substrate-binding protein DctP [Vineibacter terrae]TXL81702.1 C4-dicarboxylate ABC transporter [Vineibacter terrae]
MKLGQASLAGAALAAILAIAPAAVAQITIKIADSLPVGHYVSQYFTKPWMEAVTKQTNGKVTFEYYPAEQLGKAKDMLALTQSGVADIAYVVPSFVPEKMPMSPVAELPLAEAIGCRGAEAYTRLVNRDSQLRKLDFDANRVRPLLVQSLPPYQIFTARKISSLKELEGMKIRVTGSAKAAVMQRVGAVPVQIPTPEVREALSRGTVDGMMFVYTSLFPYDLHPLVKSATTEVNFGGWISSYVISDRKWKSLPAGVQGAMTTLADKYNREGCEKVMADDLRDRERLVQGGVSLLRLSDAEKADFAQRTRTVAEQWAADLDKRGRPGSAVLKEYRDELAKN